MLFGVVLPMGPGMHNIHGDADRPIGGSVLIHCQSNVGILCFQFVSCCLLAARQTQI